MGRTKVYKLIGDPIAWQRTGVKFSTRKIYDSQKNDKLIVGLHFQKQHNDEPTFNSPICMEMKFFFHCPRTKLRTPQWYSLPPDLDNLCKFYADCFQQANVIYNDKLIVKWSAEKRYTKKGEEPYSLFVITEAKDYNKKPELKITLDKNCYCKDIDDEKQ